MRAFFFLLLLFLSLEIYAEKEIKVFLPPVQISEKISKKVGTDFRSRLIYIFGTFSQEYRDFNLLSDGTGKDSAALMAEATHILNFRLDSVGVFIDSFVLEKVRRQAAKDSIREQKKQQVVNDKDRMVKYYSMAATVNVLSAMMGGPFYYVPGFQYGHEPQDIEYVGTGNPILRGHTKPIGKVQLFLSWDIQNKEKQKDTCAKKEMMELEVFDQKMPDADAIWDALLQMACNKIRDDHPFLKTEKRKTSQY